MSSDLEEQHDELLALLSIFDPEEFVRNESTSSGEFRVCAEVPEHFTVALRQVTVSFVILSFQMRH
uniref:RWD domain-containing protein n=1 Tax=Neogobius melanostomus TaxID=47308 RepID=A0A8C6UUJ1_9GOBI